MPHGSGVDTGFTYLGGFPTSAYTDEVEGGLIFSAQNDWYSPYMRIPGINNGKIIEVRDDAHHTSGGPPANWPCSVALPFFAVFFSWGWCPSDNDRAGGNAKCSNQTTPPQTEFAYWNVYCLDSNCNGEQILAVSVIAGTYPYHGWPCITGACQLQIITSIAQNGTNFNPNPAETFGPIWYSNAEFDPDNRGALDWGSAQTQGCQNFKPWKSTDQNMECYNGPPGGALTTYVKETGFAYLPYNGGLALSTRTRIDLP